MESNKAPYINKGIWGTQMRAFISDPTEYSLKNTPGHGPVFEVQMLFRRVFVITGPDEIQQVLQSHHRNYYKSPFYEQLKLALGNGLLNSEGDFWKQQRKLIQPVFYKSALDGLFSAMRTETAAYCTDLKARTSKDSKIDLSKEMMRLASNIVLQTLFSAESLIDRDELYEMMVFLQEYVMMRALRPHYLPWAIINGQHRKFKKYKKKIDASVYHMIDARKKVKDPPHDLLSLLIHSKDAETQEGMSTTAIRDELITLFAAGHETSANALTWTLWLLSQNPGKLAILQQEIDQLDGRLPEMKDIFQMPYTKAVIEEGMRLFPPAFAVGRLAISDDIIGGFEVPKNSIIFLSIYALHRDPEIWGDPDAFRPERFMPDAPPVAKNAYIPFGFGPRKCIGYQFAMMEMQLIIPALLQNFSFQFTEGEPEKQTLITLRPKGGMEAKVSCL